MNKVEAKRAKLQEAWSEARRLRAAGDIMAARQVLEKIAAAAPREPLVWLELGNVHLYSLQLPMAIADFERYLALAGEGPEVLTLLGRAKYMHGRTGEALAHFDDVLKRFPDYPAVYYDYSGVRRFDAETGGPLVEKIKALLANRKTSAHNRKFLHFAAGKICQDLERWDIAYGHYEKGNDLHEETYDPGAINRLTDDIKRAFTPGSVSVEGDAGSQFIFIVGMPRSGSSLIEQLLLAHGSGDIGSAGETAAFVEVTDELNYPNKMDKLTPAVRAQAAEYYGRLVGSVAGNVTRILDKNLFNFARLGAIRTILPGARIIHCRRDPLETCWSCYSTLFETGIGFAYDVKLLADYHAAYEAIMAHWRSIGVEMLEIDYEQMISDPEAVVTGLHTYLGLETDLHVLDATRRTGPVTTASKWQARQPLYKTALERARRYGPALDPLRAALGISADPSPEG